MWAIEINWIKRTGENSGFGLTRIDPASQSQILGVQDCSPTQVKALGSGYWRMIGTTEQLMEKAEAIGQRWLKGIGITRQIQKA